MIERITILSLVTIGLCCPFWDDMIFEKQGNWLKQKIGDILKPKLPRLKRFEAGEWVCKPLFGCYVCATFWWGIVQCAVYGWPLYFCLPSMGLSAILSQLASND